MRRSLIAVVLLGLTSSAYAADFESAIMGEPRAYAPSPYRPAAPIYNRWSGFYVGGQGGYGNAHVDFSSSTESLVAYLLRELALENEQHVSTWQVLGNKDTGGASGGAFVGYNSQWDDVILGVELTYNKANFFAEAPSDPIGRVTSAGGNTYDVTVSGNASAHIHDYGTARVRAGYIMKMFMPWAMVGVAAGRMDYQRTATVDGIENFAVPLPCGSPAAANCVPFNYSKSDGKNNAWIYGWTAGAGIDVMVMPHVFVRAEYEYTNFVALAGIKSAINSVHLGAGLKF